jgi:serine/threonine-protein kinase SRPK3
VALKIIVADPKRKSYETEILQMLSRNSSDHPGRNHILQLLDHFQISGPNGTHDVVVTDILVSLRTLRDLKSLDSKRASLQVVLGLAYLQQQGIIHGGTSAATLHV